MKIQFYIKNLSKIKTVLEQFSKNPMLSINSSEGIYVITVGMYLWAKQSFDADTNSSEEITISIFFFRNFFNFRKSQTIF